MPLVLKDNLAETMKWDLTHPCYFLCVLCIPLEDKFTWSPYGKCGEHFLPPITTYLIVVLSHVRNNKLAAKIVLSTWPTTCVHSPAALLLLHIHHLYFVITTHLIVVPSRRKKQWTCCWNWHGPPHLIILRLLYCYCVHMKYRSLCNFRPQNLRFIIFRCKKISTNSMYEHMLNGNFLWLIKFWCK